MALTDWPLLAWLFSLCFPLIMMGITACFFFLNAFLNPHLVVTLQIDKIRSRSFAMFWGLFGKLMADDFPSPYLDNIITEFCHGKILDIGPGSGFQLKRFREAHQQRKIDVIYAVEPGYEMHDQLKAEATNTFGEDGPMIYRILTAGAQPSELVPALAKNNVLGKQDQGIFDTIVCLRALCGIPEPQETANLFYQLLKPGGRIIFFEHVVNSGHAERGGNQFARNLQYVYMLLGWRFWNGGCELTRDTTKVLKAAAATDGGWARTEVFDRESSGCVPHIYGYMQKKGAT